MEISEGVIHHGLTLLDLHNSSDDTQPHPTLLLMTLWWKYLALISHLNTHLSQVTSMQHVLIDQGI